MDSFRYILYVYKRTLLRASGREKDKKTRCGSARRSNGTTGGSKTHNHNPGTLSAQVSLSGQNTVVRRVSIPSFKGDVRHIGDINGGSFDSNWGAAIVGHSDSASSMEPYVAVYVWRRTA